jgi:hypothetical protein
MEMNAMRYLNRNVVAISTILLAMNIFGLEAKADECGDRLAPFTSELKAESYTFDAAMVTSDKVAKCQAVKSVLGSVAYFIEITYNPDYIKTYLSPVCSDKQIADSRAPWDALFRKIDDSRLSNGCG